MYLGNDARTSNGCISRRIEAKKNKIMGLPL